MHLHAIRREAEASGLVLRGAFLVGPDDEVPPLDGGVAARALVLLGNVGSSLWPAFSAGPEYADGAPHPLDRWTQRIGEQLAARCAGQACFPFGGPPYAPFLRWARRAGGVSASPLGLLAHQVYGLWHAYRLALLLPYVPEGLEAAPAAPGPCGSCTSAACLQGCPVGAFGAEGYDVTGCAGHLRAHPEARCWSEGCLARRACPVGQDWRYLPEQARFHMSAFVAARG